MRIVKKAQKGRRNPGRERVYEEDRPSFFRFFLTPQFPEIGDEIDQNDLEELTAQVQEDFEIGCEIRDRICTSAILWYTGEAANDEDDEDDYDIDALDDDDDDDDVDADEDAEGNYDDEDEDEDDEDEEDDDDFDDDDDDDDESSTNKNSIQNPECKQQWIKKERKEKR